MRIPDKITILGYTKNREAADPSSTRPSGVSNRMKYVNIGIDFNDYGEW